MSEARLPAFRFDRKYLVVKIADINAALTLKERGELTDMLDKVNGYRHAIGKMDNTYLVINMDEPYAPRIARIMVDHGHYAGPNESEDDLRLPYEPGQEDPLATAIAKKAEEDARVGRAVEEWRQTAKLPSWLTIADGYKMALNDLAEVVAKAREGKA